MAPLSSYCRYENDVFPILGRGNHYRAEFGFWSARFSVAPMALHTHCLLVLRDPNHTSYGFTFRTLPRVTDINHKLNPSFSLFVLCVNVLVYFLSELMLRS
jgi:hypothetical protein